MITHCVDGPRRHYIPQQSDSVIVLSGKEGENK